jgi:hypothetical protein
VYSVGYQICTALAVSEHHHLDLNPTSGLPHICLTLTVLSDPHQIQVKFRIRHSLSRSLHQPQSLPHLPALQRRRSNQHLLACLACCVFDTVLNSSRNPASTIISNSTVIIHALTHLALRHSRDRHHLVHLSLSTASFGATLTFVNFW